MTDGKGRLKAAWTLVLLAPLCAEGAFTGISLPAVWLAFPLLIPIYGAGVLLARELVCRAGAGWPGLLLLGLAYELAEDGLGLQALTSPNLYGAAQWGRVFGVNVTYWESQIGYHLVFSVLIPVALANLVFKRHAGRPYLGRFGLIGTAIVFIVGIALTRLAIAGTQDPGYQEPWSVSVTILIAMLALGILALVVVPRLSLPRPTPFTRLPHAAMLGVVAGLAPIAFLGLIFPLRLGGASHGPAIGQGAWVAIPMLISLAVAITVGWLVARWSATPTFGDHHRIWLIGGALVGHSALAVASGIAGGQLVPTLALGAIVIALTILLLSRLARRSRQPVG
ncbi:hypothetical protein JJ691_23900 [Kutzneria sp. CA-103260]|nr:hypothetical protein JJ691_23900 [Kutzneria sp. CA-103260]